MIHLRRWFWLPLLFAGTPAYAHSSLPGIKGFYVGLLHPFSTPSQAVLMLGLGLLVGSYRPLVSNWFFGAFLALSIVGSVIGAGAADLEIALFAAAFLACSLAALAPGRGFALALALTGVGAFLIGAASIPDPGPTRDRVITMAGSLVGANLGLLYLWGALRVVQDRITWRGMPIALRIVAAWSGAIALLMLALRVAAPVA